MWKQNRKTTTYLEKRTTPQLNNIREKLLNLIGYLENGLSIEDDEKNAAETMNAIEANRILLIMVKAELNTRIISA